MAFSKMTYRSKPRVRMIEYNDSCTDAPRMAYAELLQNASCSFHIPLESTLEYHKLVEGEVGENVGDLSRAIVPEPLYMNHSS